METCAYLYSCSVLDSPELWSAWMPAQLTFTSSKPLEKSHTLILTAVVHAYIHTHVFDANRSDYSITGIEII